MTLRDEATNRLSRHFIPLEQWLAPRVVGAQVATAAFRVPLEDASCRNLESDHAPNLCVCHSNNEIWERLLFDRIRRTDLKIALDSFFLFEWFPRSPGLFHTERGRGARNEAQHRIVRVDDGTVFYDPYGKECMLDGGVGTVRFRPIDIAGESFYLMTASSSGVCHEGFPIALPESMYNNLIDEIRDRGSVVRTVKGKLRFVPDRLRSFYADVPEVPQLYLLVDQVDPARHPKSTQLEELRISVAVSFVSEFEGPLRAYATYATFDPRDQNGLREAVEWLENQYVSLHYRGRVVTDFDEQMGHFQYAPFSLEKVMGLKIVHSEVQQIGGVLGIDANRIILQQTIIQQEVFMDAKYKITGGQQGAVGDNAQARDFTQTWNGAASNIDLAALASDLAMLRTAARQEALETEHDAAIGAIANAEMAARNGNGPEVMEQLARAGKWAFDVATKIGVNVAAVALEHAMGLK